MRISKRQIDGLIGQDEAQEMIGWPVAPDYVIQHGVIYPTDGWRFNRRASLTDSDLFLSFARLGAHGDPSEARILNWVCKNGLLKRVAGWPHYFTLHEDVQLTVGNELRVVREHDLNQAPMTVRAFREEVRHANMCLRLLEDIRAGDVDNLRSRIERDGSADSSGDTVLGGHHLPIPVDEDLTDEKVLLGAELGLELIVEAQLRDIQLRFVHDYQATSRRKRLSIDCPDLFSALYYQLARLMADERPWSTCAFCGRPMVLSRPNRKTCGGACRKAKSRRGLAAGQ